MIQTHRVRITHTPDSHDGPTRPPPPLLRPPPPRGMASRPLPQEQGRPRTPSPGASRVAPRREPLPGGPPAPTLHVRGPRPPPPLRPHLHHAHGAAHPRHRLRLRPHPRGPCPEGPRLRQPPSGLPHPPPLLRRQVHRQLRRLRPPLARPPSQLRHRDHLPFQGQAVLLDPPLGPPQPPRSPPRRVRLHGGRPRHRQLPPHHLQHPRLHLLRRQGPRAPRPRDRRDLEGGHAHDHPQTPGLPPRAHPALPPPAWHRQGRPEGADGVPPPPRPRPESLRRMRWRPRQVPRQIGDGEPSRRRVHRLVVPAQPCRAGAARGGGACDVVLGGHERGNRHQRDDAGVGPSGAGAQPRRPGEALQGGGGEGGEGGDHHGGRRGGHRIPDGRREGDDAEAPAEPLRAVSRGGGGHRTRRVRDTRGGERGVLHGVGDGGPGHLGAAGGVPTGEVPEGRGGVPGGRDGDERGEDDAVRRWEENMPGGGAGDAARAADAGDDGEGVPVGWRGRGDARPHGDLRLHGGDEGAAEGRHLREGLIIS